MRILVTGGKGFFGKHVVEQFEREGPRFVIGSFGSAFSGSRGVSASTSSK